MDAETSHLIHFARFLNAWLSFEEATLYLAVVDPAAVKRAADRVRNGIAKELGDALVPEIRHGLDEIEQGIVRARENFETTPA